jgi:hypothetical protein
MAVIDIDVGSVANDGTGQTLRAAFQRVNSNYDEFYSQTSGTIIAKQAEITPAGSVPTIEEIEAVTTVKAEDSRSCLFILKDLRNSKTWLCISDGTNWQLQSMTKITV